MARPAKTKSTGKGNKPGGKTQFNAALPQQLVFDFNSAAVSGRDGVIEGLLLRYLEKARPDSPSVVQFRAKRAEATEKRDEIEIGDRVVDELDEVIELRAAVRRVRELAGEIVQVSTSALMRKPPKKAEDRRSVRKREVL